MNKIWLVIKREYLTRVKSWVFIIATLLAPFGLALIFLIPVLTDKYSSKEELNILVADQTDYIGQHLKNVEGITFEFTNENPETLKKNYDHEKYNGVLILPKEILEGTGEFTFYSERAIGISSTQQLVNVIEKIVEDKKLLDAGITLETVENLNVNLDMNTIKISSEGEQQTNTYVSAIVGYIMGFIIYIFMFVYGMMILRGVIEEKTNRIVEVMVSSVKPFYLLMGKVVGIAAVGLTQFILWIAMSTVILIGTGNYVAKNIHADKIQTENSIAAPQKINSNEAVQIVESLKATSGSLIFYFLFYFLFGYLLYGSLFAAIGSAVDQESDTQQLMFPITIPLIIPMLVMQTILNNPNGQLAVFFSIFPLFSPTIMIMRLASGDVPLWQIASSMGLLILGFVGSVWIAARIYRVGILMYGKKPSLKEMAKWMLYKK